MSELGEEMGDIMRQINFETQALNQDLMRKLNDMSETKHQQTKDKSHEGNTEENKIKHPTKLASELKRHIQDIHVE